MGITRRGGYNPFGIQFLVVFLIITIYVTSTWKETVFCREQVNYPAQQHQKLVESLLNIVTSPRERNISETFSLLSHNYYLKVYGSVKDSSISFSGSYKGPKAWELFYKQLSKVFNLNKYEFKEYTFMAGPTGQVNQSSVVQLYDIHHTIYQSLKVSISEMIYFESDPLNNVITETHLFCDTNHLANVLSVDSGKTDTETFFVVGAGLIGMLIGSGRSISRILFPNWIYYCFK
ncbi:predicted protein [Naegleria gruberi]|uniref:Predicted protein n=1 Tax=Naegleria gruberi TaxID=5762 RepID=D2V8W4_NAEGR|nr:uncharacterized protein NAEGRDRAFT_65305 [Naegleria gruberi]EFC46761.1 predicted protein [Naegleria gruberi]|eukprot:XP_002679505.1 predicted protein [Naegleria gruberi strain NEG-M]